MKMCRFVGKWITLSVLAGSFLGHLQAQDVIVGPVLWIGPGPAPASLPKAPRESPPYPDELRSRELTGYAVQSMFTLAPGETSRRRSGASNHLFGDAFNAGPPWQEAYSFSSKHNDMPVGVWRAVIFNPQSASEKSATATARLLSVTPIFSPDTPDDDTVAVVPMKLRLDSNGNVVGADPLDSVSPAMLAAIREALPAWKFSPARNGGKPISSELSLRVLCERAVDPAKWEGIPPVFLTTVKPVYPIPMRTSGITGKVLLEVDVDRDGRLLDVSVIESNNPGFDAAALTSVLQWTFQPGTVKGVPQRAKTRVPITFSISGDRSRDVFSFSSRPQDMARLPEQYRYDIPPRVKGVLFPVYPYELLRDGVKGKVSALYVITRNGEVGRVEVKSADRPEFARAVIAAVEGFRFEPAQRDNVAVETLVKFEYAFDGHTQREAGRSALLDWEKNASGKLASIKSLDAPPRPLSRRAPRYPKTADPKSTRGEAVVECVIDEQGYVRHPRVISATDPAFGYAAVQAASAWWFIPSTVNKKPVATRVQIPFGFTPAASTEPKGPADSK